MRLSHTLLLVTLASSASAQIIPQREPKLSDQWLFGISGFAGIPVGDFKQHEDGGAGLELNVGFQPYRRQPLVVRGAAGFLMYGYYNRNRDQQYCDYSNNCVDVTVFYNARYHNMSFLQIGPELMATDGKWRPFAYALGGITWFNSWANYGQPNYYGDAPSTTLLSSHNASSAYGFGIRHVPQKSGRENGWELSVRFTRNAKAYYLNDRGINYDSTSNTWYITPNSGAANVVGIHFGWWVGPFVNWFER